MAARASASRCSASDKADDLLFTCTTAAVCGEEAGEGGACELMLGRRVTAMGFKAPSIEDTRELMLDMIETAAEAGFSGGAAAASGFDGASASAAGVVVAEVLDAVA